MKFLGAVNHRPQLFMQISRQISHKFPRPEKRFLRTIRARFRALLARSAPLKPQEAGDLWGSQNTPSSCLIARNHLEATHDHKCDQVENRGRELKFPGQYLFHYKISRMPFCRECGTSERFLRWCRRGVGAKFPFFAVFCSFPSGQNMRYNQQQL